MPRVAKSLSRSRGAVHRSSLLSIFSESSREMPSCSHCERRRIACCYSPSDSSRCEACVRRGLAGCDMLGPSDVQIRTAARSFHSLDRELKAAEEAAEASQAKVRRLRRQRKVLADRVYRMVERGV